MTNIKTVAEYICNYYEEQTQVKPSSRTLGIMLYLCQREKLGLMDSPLFDETLHATESGISFDLPHTQGEALSAEERYIIRNVVVQYCETPLSELQKLIEAEKSVQSARKANGFINLEDVKKDSSKVRHSNTVWGVYAGEFEDYEG